MRSFIKSLAVILSFLLGIPGTGIAGNEPLSLRSSDTITPVIELYTSEGCSSCPPADNFLSQLGETVDEKFRAIPLAFHVDYWNWLGWKDPFSKAAYTERQRFLADVNSQRSMYTPELLVSGKEVRGGMDIVERVNFANQQESRVDIMLTIEGRDAGRISAEIAFDNMAGESGVEFHVAIFENDIVRQIKGGENKGRTLTYNYLVRHWSTPMLLAKGKSTKQLTLAIGSDWEHANLGMAVVVVNGLTGETLQALSTSLSELFSG